MKYLFGLFALLFSFAASAHCDPSQLSGAWQVRATGAQTASAGFLKFTDAQAIVADIAGSSKGSDPEGVNFPSGPYPLAWQESPVYPDGVCVIDATFSHDGVTENWLIRYPGNTKPKSLTGTGAVNAPGLHITMQLVLTR